MNTSVDARQADLAADHAHSLMPSTSAGDVGSELQRLRGKLAICHDLSKHVWEDNTKRNFRLLKDIHRYSQVNDG